MSFWDDEDEPTPEPITLFLVAKVVGVSLAFGCVASALAWLAWVVVR